MVYIATETYVLRTILAVSSCLFEFNGITKRTNSGWAAISILVNSIVLGTALFVLGATILLAIALWNWRDYL